MTLNFWSILGIVMALATVIFSVRTFLFSYIFAPALRDETLDAKSTKKTKAQIEGKRAWFARMRFMRASRRLSGQVVRMVVGTNKNSTHYPTLHHAFGPSRPPI